MITKAMLLARQEKHLEELIKSSRGESNQIELETRLIQTILLLEEEIRRLNHLAFLEKEYNTAY